MGSTYKERRIYDCPQTEVRTAAERAMYELGLNIDPDASEYELRARRSMSTFSWGERIKVLVATAPGGGTQALVESKLVFGLIDWGKNQENVKAVFDAMAPLIGQGDVVPVDA